MPDANELRPLRLAIPVTDLAAAETFYCGLLGCGKERTASHWLDLNFFGHQVTLRLTDDGEQAAASNPLDGNAVPARHFGVGLGMAEWRALADRLERAGCDFLIAPRTRLTIAVGEKATMFFRDPCGNALEFKSFADPARLFAT